MAVRDIAYVDLYTKDERAVIDLFVESMGFTQIGDYVEPNRSSVLLRQGEARIAVTSGPATWKFLDQHGDGIAEIAMVCDDVDATRRAALAVGAADLGLTYGFPAVSGFGAVTHALLPAVADPETGLPPGRRWTPRPITARAERIQALDHVAVCVEGDRLAEYADFYRDAFGMARYSAEYVDLGAQAMDSIVVRSPSEKVTFTLVAPVLSKNPGQLDAFLSRNGGPGVQHLAFLVDDIVAAAHDCGRGGIKFLETPDAYYASLPARFDAIRGEIAGLRAASVLVDRDEWGYLLQAFTQSPHERNTLFYEFIQRRGSRGFGSANIRALYEAVDRDQVTAR
jgi:4-hydroxymandelate synthase